MELIESLQGFVEENLALLTPVDQAWQPTDFLPDLTAEDWAEQVDAVPDLRAAGIRRPAGRPGGQHGHGRGPAQLLDLAQPHRQ